MIAKLPYSRRSLNALRSLMLLSLGMCRLRQDQSHQIHYNVPDLLTRYDSLHHVIQKIKVGALWFDRVPRPGSGDYWKDRRRDSVIPETNSRSGNFTASLSTCQEIVLLLQSVPLVRSDENFVSWVGGWGRAQRCFPIAFFGTDLFVVFSMKFSFVHPCVFLMRRFSFVCGCD